jgi:hypothetical protein
MKGLAWKAAVVSAAMYIAAPMVKAQDSPEAAAQKILAQARAAAGGEAKLKGVQSLSYSAKSRATMRMMMMGPGGSGAGNPQPQMQESEFEVDILAPDKYVRKDQREVMNGQATIISHTGFNGDSLIQRREVIGDLPLNPNMTPPDPAAAVRRAKQNFLRDWMGWLFEPPAAYGLTYRSAGNETVNGTAYEVIEVAGPDNFSAKLYFESNVHRIGMIRYRAPGAPQFTRMGGPPPGQGQAQGGNPPAEGQRQMVFQPGPAGPDVDAEIVFSDFKPVDGILLPHKMRRTTNGELSSETEIKKYKVNSTPKADKFKTTE